MSSPSNAGWLRPTEPLTMRSEVIGDFQEPYGAIFREFDKPVALLLAVLFENLPVSSVVKLCGLFSYNLAKALQGVCNLRFPEGS
jgi:hypothetical protein